MPQADTIVANKALLTALQRLLCKADQVVMQVYSQLNSSIDYKQDRSPVTEADTAAHNILMLGLAELTPNISVVSEEDPSSLAVPEQQSCYWLIDPLDGTKEFIERNGEFTVNIALIENRRPVLGFVSIPVDQTMYFGGKDLGAWRIRNGQNESIQTQANPFVPTRVIVSKSHMNIATYKFIESLGKTELIQAGSSLKFLRIAEGKADIYPRLGPTCEWDTAAAQAILEGAGGAVLQMNGSPLEYAKKNISNPHFIAYHRHPSIYSPN